MSRSPIDRPCPAASPAATNAVPLSSTTGMPSGASARRAISASHSAARRPARPMRAHRRGARPRRGGIGSPSSRCASVPISCSARATAISAVQPSASSAEACRIAERASSSAQRPTSACHKRLDLRDRRCAVGIVDRDERHVAGPAGSARRIPPRRARRSWSTPASAARTPRSPAPAAPRGSKPKRGKRSSAGAAGSSIAAIASASGHEMADVALGRAFEQRPEPRCRPAPPAPPRSLSFLRLTSRGKACTSPVVGSTNANSSPINRQPRAASSVASVDLPAPDSPVITTARPSRSTAEAWSSR